MNKNNSSFIKLNNQIFPKPLGTDYNLVSGKVYTLKSDRYNDDLYLEEDKDFEFPEKYYLGDDDKHFI